VCVCDLFLFEPPCVGRARFDPDGAAAHSRGLGRIGPDPAPRGRLRVLARPPELRRGQGGARSRPLAPPRGSCAGRRPPARLCLVFVGGQEVEVGAEWLIGDWGAAWRACLCP